MLIATKPIRANAEPRPGRCSPAPAAAFGAAIRDPLASIETLTRRDAGACIFAEHDEARVVYRVAEGVAMTYKILGDGRRQITGFHFPDDFLGLSLARLFAYGAEAVTYCTLRCYARSSLTRLVEASPELKGWALRLTNSELVAAQDQMLLLGRMRAEERLASFLCQLARRQRERGDPVNPVWLPMSRGAVGDYLGLTLETVSRIFTRLRRNGLIAKRGEHFVFIEDFERLAVLADGCG